MAVNYTTNALTPGRLYFRCERMRATLSTDACSGMWRKSNLEDDNAHEACRRCPLGALHAGEPDASLSPFRGQLVCARCHNPAQRLITGMHCVSCKNREYEFIKGRNAKGTAPVKLKCLARRRLRYLAGHEPCQLTLQRSLDIEELIVATLRDSKNRVRFGFGVAMPPAVRQLRLF
jgi:hypothetical protein